MTTSFSLAAQLRAGETVLSGWCGLGAPLLAEVIAREGFAAVTIDMQHGLWAAEKLGLAGAEAEAYAKAFVVADLESTGGHDVFGKIRQDFDAKGVNLSDHQIRRTMDELTARAVSEVKASG